MNLFYISDSVYEPQIYHISITQKVYPSINITIRFCSDSVNSCLESILGYLLIPICLYKNITVKLKCSHLSHGKVGNLPENR